MDIINMRSFDEVLLLQAAEVLSAGLPEWLPTLQEAQREIGELLIPGNTMLAAVEEGRVLGLGGILAPVYDGRVFELHPLAVRSDCRHRGVGRLIVRALEEKARERGGLTIYLGADDER